jgi:hypothetical protein
MRRLSRYADGLEEPMSDAQEKPSREECARYVDDAVMAAKLEGHAGALEGGEWGQIMHQASAYLRKDADLVERLTKQVEGLEKVIGLVCLMVPGVPPAVVLNTAIVKSGLSDEQLAGEADEKEVGE